MIDLAFGLYMAEAEGYDLTTGEKKRNTDDIYIMIERVAEGFLRNCGYMFTNDPGWHDMTTDEQEVFVNNVNYLYMIKDEYDLNYRDVVATLMNNLRFD